MSRKSENDLFELIKSLNKGEKKSFTLFANYYSEGDKSHIRLFELMDAQVNYDEEKIKLFFKKEKIKSPLPRVKNYLLEIILKSLRFHHSGKTIDSQIRALIADADIFHSKGLRILKARRLEKAKALATRYQKHEATLEIINKIWKYKLDYNNKETLKEYEQLTNKIILKRKYQQIAQDTMMLLKDGLVRSKSLKKDWEKVMLNPLLAKKNEPEGFEDNHFYHNIYLVYYERMNQFTKSWYHLEMMLKNFEKHPELISQWNSLYYSTLGNLVGILCAKKEIEKAEVTMSKLLDMQEWDLSLVDKKNLKNYIAFAHCNLLRGALFVKEFNDGVRIAKQAQAFISQNIIPLQYRTQLLLTLTNFYFCIGNYAEALKWNNKQLNQSKESQKEDDFVFAKIFNLIIHYELGNEEQLPYLMRSTQRFLNKSKKMYKTENAILRFMQTSLYASKSKQANLFKELKTDLLKITKNEFESKVIDHFDFISWLESKIENKPFIEVLKEKG